MIVSEVATGSRSVSFLFAFVVLKQMVIGLEPCAHMTAQRQRWRQPMVDEGPPSPTCYPPWTGLEHGVWLLAANRVPVVFVKKMKGERFQTAAIFEKSESK